MSVSGCWRLLSSVPREGGGGSRVLTARSVRHEEKVRVSQGREPLLKCGQVQGSRACAKTVSAAGGAGSSGGTGGGAREGSGVPGD